MSATIKAISLLQPWASLIAIGAKKIETRSWPTSHRGPLAIHASKKPTGERRWPCEELFNDLAEQGCDFGRLYGGRNTFDNLPFGVIVAVCRLTHILWTGPSGTLSKSGWLARLRDSESPELDLGNFSPRRYGWFLADVRQLPQPVPARGSLGLWDFPTDQLGIDISDLFDKEVEI